MEILNIYFNDLVFHYMQEKKNLAVYVAAVAGMLGADKMRCVIAFVPAHLGIVTKSRLKDLPWVNLQTRVCSKEDYKTPLQKWKAPIESIPPVIFTAIDRDKNYTTYVSVVDDMSAHFPLDVLMIHSPKKSSIYQYPNTMNIHWAIDQFNTVFSPHMSVYEVPKNQSPILETPISTETSINTISGMQAKNTLNSDIIEWL